MGGEEHHDRRWELHRAVTSVGLGRGDDTLTVSELDGLLLDAHLMAQDVDVASAETEELAEAQAAEAGDEHQGAVALLDGAGDANDDLGIDERSLR